MTNVSDKSCRVNQNTHFVFNIFFKENRAVYEICKSIVEQGRPQMTIWPMRFACSIPKVTHTHVHARTHTHTHTQNM